MKICLVKNLNNTFSIAFNSDYEKAKKLKVGEEYFFEVKKSRNIKFHRKAFALFNLVFENQERYTNLNDLRHDLTISAGYYSERTNLLGEVIKEADSISFAQMDELQFSEYYDSIIKQIVLHFNFNKQDIIDNVSQYF